MSGSSDPFYTIDGQRQPWEDTVARTMFLFNVTGLPALCVPSGLSDTGLPIGIQIVAWPLADSVCLDVGHAYQRLASHHLAAPPLVASLATKTNTAAE